ncbi:hypothetical protein [Streptomyces sp. NPDC007369]|uniref:hypothetical protein n=1 Tax=Streptomyces sp. NPDC007369 TaxID=3154589 RepID=UPI003408A2BC
MNAVRIAQAAAVSVLAAGSLLLASSTAQAVDLGTKDFGWQSVTAAPKNDFGWQSVRAAPKNDFGWQSVRAAPKNDFGWQSVTAAPKNDFGWQ